MLRDLLNFVYYIRERFWVFLGKEREDLAVKDDVIQLEGVDELGVRKAKWAECGIHLYGPKTAEDVLLVFAVCKSVLSSVCNSDACLDLFLAASKAVALDLC